ncbi:hypothetical protein C8J56DRAFT_768015 [Mycena floridula]|nr:hypothetical protein C8J56DRAFT_768015 [Mycena floridula]
MDFDEQSADEDLDDQPEQPDQSQAPRVGSQRCPKPADQRAPTAEAIDTLKCWNELIPSVSDSYLEYLSRTLCQTTLPPPVLRYHCTKPVCVVQELTILCLHLLVESGLFPGAPLKPRIAVSIELLDLYRALFERSCDSIHAFAASLHTVYERNGFRILDNSGDTVLDPFRRSLGCAVQWYDALVMHIESSLDAALQHCDETIQAINHRRPVSASPLSSPFPGEAHRMLRQMCPACFGASVYGRSFQEGGDIHVALDGNFHHKHIKGVVEDLPFRANQRILSKAFVDGVRDRLDQARGREPKDYQPIVPDIAIDSCQESHHAAKDVNGGDDVDSNGKGITFDDKGLMALVCRHDIPLFFANIDTPGEGQQYGIALLEFLFMLLPLNATVLALYDIGCVVDRSINKYDLLPEWITSRLMLALSAMHAYGHQWSCQLIYNPRLRHGLGLTDGKGVERLWSRLRKLIGVERRSGRSRRLWLIDRQADAIAFELRDGLGEWMHTRLNKGVLVQAKKAQALLDSSGVEIHVLRSEWRTQKQSQLSSRSHAPAQLKKEVSKLMALQAQISGIDSSIENVQKAIRGAHGTRQSLELIKTLQATQTSLKCQVDSLYASLNLSADFPTIVGLSIEHVQTLIMARSLKTVLRKKAISSFMEWDRLGQSIGGRQQTIGTEKHQQARKTIARRKPILVTMIRLYNNYCNTLAKLHTPASKLPVPCPLPTDLKSLRASDDLLQDVCLEQSTGPVPRWMDDQKTRQGIHAMLKLDRCHEECARLSREAQHLVRWFQRELASIELACRLPEYQRMRHLLEERRLHLLFLKSRWQKSLASEIQFDHAVKAASETANSVAGAPCIHYSWIHVQGMYDDAFVKPSAPADGTSFTSEESVGSDVLAVEAGQIDSDVDDDPEDVAGPPDSDSDDEEILEGLRAVLPTVSWTCPVSTSSVIVDSSSNAPRRIPATIIDFDKRDLVPLLHHQGRITSGSLNALAALLHKAIKSSTATNTAIFPSWFLPYANSRKEDSIWRLTRDTEFWNKDIWVFPIHRPAQEHWVLTIAIRSSRHFYLFDSFAGNQQSWTADLLPLASAMDLLASIARAHHRDLHLDMLSVWTASPLSTEAVQTNNYDCGLWVISVIAAVLRETHITDLTEADMPTFRALCHRLTQLVPLK